MGAIENMAAFVAILSLVKLVWVYFNPKGWMNNVSKPLFKMNQFVWLILAAVAGYYILQIFTIVEVFAVFLFMIPLMAMSYSLFGKEFLELGDKLLRKKNFWQKSWLIWLVWTVMSLWVLKDIFMR